MLETPVFGHEVRNVIFHQMEFAQRTDPFDIFWAVDIRHKTLTGHVEGTNFNPWWMSGYVQETNVQGIDWISLSDCRNRIVVIT